jgi:hypothetical protein
MDTLQYIAAPPFFREVSNSKMSCQISLISCKILLLSNTSGSQRERYPLVSSAQANLPTRAEKVIAYIWKINIADQDFCLVYEKFVSFKK